MIINLQKIKVVSINVLAISSPLWLPLLVASIAAYFGCCGNRDDLNNNGLLFFGVLPGIVSFFIGAAKVYKLTSNDKIVRVVTLITYVFVSIFLLMFVLWGALLILGAGP